ncbi:Gfo/Idh/MocA family protein [Marinivivus vitaminiproducens]|uniref:Gfo/Idh/MocA family protein n=1 Tax=Marinivivus vitaminiproducens TaxID=3035935 RepID=UPI0027A154CF|nr:Gfo/Idh/MocA family oxidoreductase [Geminicoccaceae bacterium SCSIO 64248]
MKLTAVLVGCGAMSRKWLEAAQAIDDLDVVGLVDLDVERARLRREEFLPAHCAISADLEAMLAEHRPDIVFDVVVPEARYGLVRTAFRYGCHVLSEKPMADSLENAASLVDLARQAGRVHAVVQNRRYIDGVRRIRHALASGLIGDVTSVHSDFFLAPHFGGFREAMEHVLLLDMAIHTFDAARYIIDALPQAVYCREVNPSNSWYAHGASAFATFEFAGDVIYTYRGSWCADGLRTSWESAWRIVGTRGTLTWDGDRAFRAERVTGPGIPTGSSARFSEVEASLLPPAGPCPSTGGHAGVMRDFIGALRGGPLPETVGSENIKSLAMVFGAIESARSGARVPIDPLAKRETGASMPGLAAR